MTALALDAAGVSVAIGGRDILSEVSVQVGFGEVHALIGPNGAGKSTLLAALAGDTGSTGAISIGGTPISGRPARDLARRRAVLLQDNPVLFPFTVRQVVEMGRAPWRGTELESEDDDAIDEAMALTEIGALAGRPVPQLSGGERARTALARVLAQRTDLLLLDEPTAALDLKHQEDVLRLTRSRAAGGAAVVVVLHDLNLAAALADRITLLDAGRVSATGTPVEVLTAERLGAVYRQPVELIPHPASGIPIILPVRSAS